MTPADSKRATKPVLLAVPIDLLNQLDIATKAMKMPRTQVILRSLRRDLNTTLRHEVFKRQHQDRDMIKEFGDWS